MKTIIMATDFSSAADNAANYSADMALAVGANLHLLNVYTIPDSYDEMTKATESELDKLKERLMKRTHAKITISREVRLGGFFHELKLVCEEKLPFVVVMGSQGTTGAERFFFGSHTVHAMKHLNWPMITVPPDITFSSIRKIGLACDFEDDIYLKAVDEVRLLVKEFKAELHILNLGKIGTFKPEIVFESVALREKINDLDPNYHFIANENLDEGILEFVEKNQIDLLVVVPRRHNLVERLINRSHTKQFVLHSHVPVMSVHP